MQFCTHLDEAGADNLFQVPSLKNGDVGNSGRVLLYGGVMLRHLKCYQRLYVACRHEASLASMYILLFYFYHVVETLMLI